jgi:hypothetical protein
MADLEGRLTKVPYDQAKPVHAVFDLGWADNTAIWFVQFISFEIRLIRYLEDNQKDDEPLHGRDAEVWLSLRHHVATP